MSFGCFGRSAGEGSHEADGSEPRMLEGERYRVRFHLEAVHVTRGPRVEPSTLLPGFQPGMTVVRRELSAPRRPAGLGAPATLPMLGAIDPRHSSADEDVAALLRQWHGNPFRVAMVLACAHSRAWLDAKPEDRNFDHLATPDIGRLPGSLRRVVRQLHRGNPVGGDDWDTFAYFEMLPAHVAHLREYLAEQRESRRMARLVEREVEIWMIKHLDGFEPAQLGGGQA